MTRRLRNRDLELCSPRGDSAEWDITLGCPSVDRYYLESSDSFVSSCRALPASLFVFIQFYSRIPFSLILSLTKGYSLDILVLVHILPRVAVPPFLSRFLLPPILLSFALAETRLDSLFFRISREKCCLTHYCPYSECRGKNIAESERSRLAERNGRKNRTRDKWFDTLIDALNEITLAVE